MYYFLGAFFLLLYSSNDVGCFSALLHSLLVHLLVRLYTITHTHTHTHDDVCCISDLKQQFSSSFSIYYIYRVYTNIFTLSLQLLVAPSTSMMQYVYTHMHIYTDHHATARGRFATADVHRFPSSPETL